MTLGSPCCLTQRCAERYSECPWSIRSVPMNNVCGVPCSRKVIIPHCSTDSVVQCHTTYHVAMLHDAPSLLVTSRPRSDSNACNVPLGACAVTWQALPRLSAVRKRALPTSPCESVGSVMLVGAEQPNLKASIDDRRQDVNRAIRRLRARLVPAPSPPSVMASGGVPRSD